VATLETIQPYVEQLFDDSDVQKQLSRAAANLRGAKARATSARSKKKALKDPKLHQRLLAAARATIAAGTAIGRGAEKQQRRSRRGRVLLLAGLAAGAGLAASEPVRRKVLALIPDRGPQETAG
jgi:hypothetical protein